MPDTPAWVSTPLTGDLLRGALDLERTARGVLPHRLPAWARRQIPDDQLATAEAQPSGVRLAFRTGATAVELDVLPTKLAYPVRRPVPPGSTTCSWTAGSPGGRVALGGNIRTIDMATGAATPPARSGASTLRFTGLAGGTKDVEIWLPHNEITELVALRTDAPVAAVPGPGRRVWLHHGSSISHGSNAESPTTTWPALRRRARGRRAGQPRASAAAPCSTRSSRAPCATPRRTWSASRSGSTWSTST